MTAHDTNGRQPSPPSAPRRLAHFLARAAAPLLVILVALGVAALAQLVPARNRTGEPKEKPPINVKVVRVRPERQFADSFVLSGAVAPDRIVTVSAEEKGRVTKILRAEGEACPAGVVLLELDHAILEAEHAGLVAQKAANEAQVKVAEAQDALNQAEQRRAEAQKEFDENDYERQAKLRKQNVSTDLEVEQARTKLKASTATIEAANARVQAGKSARVQAEAMLEATAAAVRAAKTRLDRTYVRAPVSGTLHKITTEEGNYVMAGAPVATIIDIATALVVVDVPELDIDFLRMGDRAQVILDERGGRAVTGTITYIGALADPDSRTTRVEVSVANRDRQFRDATVEAVEDGGVRIAARIPAGAAAYYERAGLVDIRVGGQTLPVRGSVVTLSWPKAKAPSTRSGEIRPGTAPAPAQASPAFARVVVAVPGVQGALSPGGAVAIRPADDLLRSGKIVRVRLTRQVLPEVIFVPLAAIVPGENSKSVYVVAGGKAKRRDDVTLGLLKGRDVQVLDGLEAGDLLIMNWQYVGPEDDVKIIEEVDPDEFTPLSQVRLGR